MIVGNSGSGKSSTFRNLPPEKTVVINTERKPLPFKSFRKFKNIDISSYKKFVQVLAELKKNDEYEYVVIDSLTSLTEIINRYAEVSFNGYEIWKKYNEFIQDTLWAIKDLPQQVFMTGIPEHMDMGFGDTKGFVRVKGKELKYGGVEKEFAVVMWTKLIEDDDGVVVDYQLEYKPNKHNSAKAPAEMFEGEIKNDALKVDELKEAYYEES